MIMSLEDIETYRKEYEAQARPERQYIGTINLFFLWYNNAKAFFKVNVDNKDEDYIAFANAEPSGNEYVLHGYYEELSGRYYALVALYNANKKQTTTMSSNKVFIVHGHDELLLNKVESLLCQLGLTPIILNQQANSGFTLIDKLERYTDVFYAIVLYTPCDKGKAKEDKSKYKFRARQNVVFEHGYLMAKLGRQNIAVLKQGDVEMPSDISGIAYVESGEWRYKLADEMKTAGMPVDKNKIH